MSTVATIIQSYLYKKKIDLNKDSCITIWAKQGGIDITHENPSPDHKKIVVLNPGWDIDYEDDVFQYIDAELWEQRKYILIDKTNPDNTKVFFRNEFVEYVRNELGGYMVYRESSANDHLRDNYPNLELEIESAEEVFGTYGHPFFTNSLKVTLSRTTTTVTFDR